MALEKQITVDEITVTALGVVMVRELVEIVENGNVISTTVQRKSFSPGSNIVDQPAQVQAICNASWTPEIIEKAKQSLAVVTEVPQRLLRDRNVDAPAA